MNYLKNLGAKVSVLPILFLPSIASATGITLDSVAPESLREKADIGTIIAGLISVFLGVLGIIFFLLTLYAGFLYMTAAGEDDKVTKAKKLLTQAIIGLVIIIASYAISKFVTDQMLNISL